jgi:large subunit ribosomal protein L10
MVRPEKAAEVDTISEKLRSAQSMVLADFTGLSVAQMTEFRSRCRAEQVECRVVKNRLAKIAADRVDLAVLKDHLVGPTALVLGLAGQVDAAKIVVDFARDNEALTVKGGFVGEQYLDPQQVVALAKTPSRDELIAKMMGSINSPLVGLAGTVNGVIAALTRALNAVAGQKEAAAAN